MLLLSTYPQYLMRHETGSEHNRVVYFLLANKEQQKTIQVYIHLNRRKNGHGRKGKVFNIKMPDKTKVSDDEQEGIRCYLSIESRGRTEYLPVAAKDAVKFLGSS